MLGTVLLTGAECLQLAVLAFEVFFLGLFFEASLGHTINHATEVWLLALKALVDGTGVHSEAFKIAEVIVTFASDSFIGLEALCLRSLHRN